MTRALRALGVAAALAAVACGGESGPSSCADRLDGIYAATGDNIGRFHVVELGGGVEIYALGEPAKRDRSASYVRLARDGDGLSGHGQRFQAEGERVCRVRWPVSGRCGDGALVLSVAEPGALDMTDCSQAEPGPARPLVLRRVRAL